MPVPETAVDKDDLFTRTEHEVGLAGQILAVKPIPKPETVHQTPHDELRLHILAFDTPHIFGTALRRQLVHDAYIRSVRSSSRVSQGFRA